MMQIKNMAFKGAAVDVPSRTFTGYASVFGNIDSYGDIMEKGAFKKTIQERGDRIKVMYNHTFTIGRSLELEETPKGLFVKGYISQTHRGDEVLTLMADGAIDEMSIGYQAVKHVQDTHEGKSVRRLTEVKLFEFSPVDFAANDQAIITGIKALAFKRGFDIDEMRIEEIIEQLREPKEAPLPEPIKSLLYDDVLIREEFERKLRMAQYNIK
jgi:HK97 family phage prohead protease